MNSENIFNSKNIFTIAIIVIIVVVLGVVISLTQTPKYKSSSKLLVIFSQDDMSPYASAQTSNYISGILKEVVYSDSFIDMTLKSGFDLNKEVLGFGQEERAKNWKKMVKTNLLENKGVIIIDVYHKNNDQAKNYAQAISHVLITNHNLYHGSENAVTVKMIDTPIAPEKWSKPDILQNTMLSLIAGIFISLTFIIIFPEQELINYIFGKRSAKKDETIYFHNQEQITEQETKDKDENKNNSEYYNW